MTRLEPSRRRFIASVGGITFVSLAGCSTRETDPSTTNSPTPTPPPNTEDQSGTGMESTPEEVAGAGTSQTSIRMITDNKGSYFDPKGILIEAGTTVRFENASGSHATTAYHPENDDKPLRIPEEATAWDSGIYTDPGETYEHTFDEVGVYDYYCPPHEMLGMVGRIIVGEPRDGPGTTAVNDLPPAAADTIPKIDAILDDQVVTGP